MESSSTGPSISSTVTVERELLGARNESFLLRGSGSRLSTLRLDDRRGASGRTSSSPGVLGFLRLLFLLFPFDPSQYVPSREERGMSRDCLAFWGACGTGIRAGFRLLLYGGIYDGGLLDDEATVGLVTVSIQGQGSRRTSQEDGCSQSTRTHHSKVCAQMPTTAERYSGTDTG